VNADPVELRVLGSLIEKQRTTPDAYPLSLNALRAACNQATNRDPVVAYDETTVRDALERLGRRRWARLAGIGRATKYGICSTTPWVSAVPELALLCVLMLRGPQTPGELRQRTERLHAFTSGEDLERTLERLIERRLVARLQRRPGQKEQRYTQLLGTTEETSPVGPAVDDGVRPPVPGPERGPGSTEDLEPRVARLEERLAELEAALGVRADGPSSG
jgi:uncharacterized protein YceH (UPF0502 family)